MTRRVARTGDNEGVTELMKAAADRDTEKIKAIVEAGGDLAARDKNGRNILYHAFTDWTMTNEVLEVFQLLGNYGVNFNANLDTDGCTALITAISLDWPDLVQELVSFGADIHEEGMSKFGPCISSHLGNGDSVEQQDRFIFSKGCSQCVSPLLCATMLKRHAITNILLMAGADCQQISFGSFWKSSNIGACSVCDVYISPIHMAAYHGDAELLGRFLQVCQMRCLKENSDFRKPLTVSQNSEEDITPLWLALLRGKLGAVKALLEYDHPRAPPCHFGSGLYVCLAEDHCKIARLLLLAGYNLWEDLEWIESEDFPTNNKEIVKFIQDFVSKPRSLLICSRNALRHHMGPRLPTYLAMVKIPHKVADVILLKDILYSDAPASLDDITVMLPDNHQ